MRLVRRKPTARRIIAQSGYNPAVQDNQTVKLNPKFITDKAGRRTAAVLPMKEFKALLEALEDRIDMQVFEQRLMESKGLISWREVEAGLKGKGKL